MLSFCAYSSSASPQPVINIGLLQTEIQIDTYEVSTEACTGIWNKKFKFYPTMDNKLTYSWPVAIPVQRPTGHQLTPFFLEFTNV